MNRRVIRKELWTKFDVERRNCKGDGKKNGFRGILCHGNQGREKQQFSVFLGMI